MPDGRYQVTVNYHPEAVDSLIEHWRAEARALLRQYWPCVVAIADELLVHGTLSGAQVNTVVAAALVSMDRHFETAQRIDWRHRVENVMRAPAVAMTPIDRGKPYL